MAMPVTVAPRSSVSSILVDSPGSAGELTWASLRLLLLPRVLRDALM